MSNQIVNDIEQNKSNPAKKCSFFETLKIHFTVQGLFLGYGLLVWTYRLFLMAYFSEEKKVVLYIDVFGEAFFELILMTASIFLMTFAVIQILRMIRSAGKK